MNTERYCLTAVAVCQARVSIGQAVGTIRGLPKRITVSPVQGHTNSLNVDLSGMNVTSIGDGFSSPMAAVSAVGTRYACYK
jgi:hypothetical protein